MSQLETFRAQLQEAGIHVELFSAATNQDGISGAFFPKDVAIFLHGFPAYSGKNEDLAAWMASEHGLAAVVLHYPGLGKSKGRFSFCGALDVARNLIAACLADSSGRVFLVGHSFGGYLAASLWNELPKIAGAVLLSPLAEIPADDEIFQDLGYFAAAERELGHEYSASDLLVDAQEFRTRTQKMLADRIASPSRPAIRILQAINDDVNPPDKLPRLLRAIQPAPIVRNLEDDHWFSNREQTRSELAAAMKGLR